VAVFIGLFLFVTEVGLNERAGEADARAVDC
jgi:hypothetical protein